MYIIDSSLRGSFASKIGKCMLIKGDLTLLTDIECAAKEVYPVINPRNKGFKIILPKNVHIVVLNSIAKRVWEYFNLKPNTPNTQANFDAFHGDLCCDFLSGMNVLRAKAGFQPMTYGIAQKYINMLFKYLACFGNYLRFADLFSYCHIPIDRQILNLFEKLGVPRVKKEQFKSLNWSDLSVADYQNLLDDYRKVLTPLMPNHPWLAFDFVGWTRGAKLSCATVRSYFLKTGTFATSISGFFR
ncbi:MAG: hypothetical protein K5753_07080 [Clostridia bacterium]|nr:hypothetical protein [Clostridia bacterium]